MKSDGFKISNTSGTQRLDIDSSGNWEIGTSTTNYTYRFHGNTDTEFDWKFYESGVISKQHYAEWYQPSQGNGYSVFVINNDGSKVSSPGYNLMVIGTIHHNGIYTGSDSRIKTNVSNIETAVDTVNQLQGVTFDWKTNEELGFEVPARSDGRQYGFIAQDIEQVIPEIVQGDGDDIKSLKYDALIPVLVEAIKELKAEIEILKAA